MYGRLKRFKLFRLQEHIWYLAIKIFSASSANLFTYFPLKRAACHYPNNTLVNDMTLVALLVTRTRVTYETVALDVQALQVIATL